MASITNVVFSATKRTDKPGTWDLTVTYDAVFSRFELENFNFRDGFEVWEDDPINDDKLTGVVGVSTFNPSVSPTKRTLKATVSEDLLDTELFKEELFTIVRLRNLDLNLLQTKKSPILKLNP